MDTLGQDVRQASAPSSEIRVSRSRPSLAPTLGIGVNTATFSVVDAVLLRPLPYPEADRVLGVWATAPDRGLDLTQVSYQRFAAMAESNHSFEALGAYTGDTVTFTGGDEPRQWNALRCSSGLLDALRVRPILGRNFRAEEDGRGGGAVGAPDPRPVEPAVRLRSRIVGRALAVDGASPRRGRRPAGRLQRFPDAPSTSSCPGSSSPASSRPAPWSEARATSISWPA